ncbi:MAG: PAS domain S-box protein [Deltaproteobacteria bacterium]|nr:PAS domain S-box protein [Deltaproteobacteria bacterium]
MGRTPRSESGEDAGTGGVSVAADHSQRLAGALDDRRAVEDLLTGILTRFARLPGESLDEGVREALGEVGEFLRADRARILVFCADGATFENTHDWCAAGVDIPPGHARVRDIAEFPWIYARLARGETVHLESVSRLPPEAAAEKTALELRGVRSALFQPIVVGAQLLGAAQWEWVRGETSWSEEGLRLFSIITQVIAGAMARKLSQQELRASEEKFRGLVEHINEIIYSLDANGIITYVSPAVERAAGYTPPEVIGHSFLEYIHPDDQPALLESYLEVLAGRYGPSEYRVFDKSGQVRWVRSTSRLIHEHGEVVGLRAVLMDITERKQVEVAIEQGERRWRSLIEHSSDGIVLFDVHDVILYASPGALKVVGLSAHELVGRRGADFVHPDDRRALVAAMAAAVMVPGASFTNTMRLRHRDGTWRWVESVATNLLDDPSVAAVVANYHDITDSRRAAEEIAALNQTLERRVAERTAELATANTELESFSYSVSHDLRAPLRNIDAWSMVLLEEHRDQLRPEGREMLTRIRRSVHRMGRLIDDLLGLSRVSRAKLRREPVDLSALARAVVAELRHVEPDRVVEFVIAADAVGVGDPGLLRVVLENLLGNAWKFTGKCTQARIEFGRSASESAGEGPVFFVKDNGAGFDMRFVAKLFGAFQRLHGVAEFPGTGIGLATVQRIVARHGGRVWAESAPGEGAAFYFTLRREPSSPERRGYL